MGGGYYSRETMSEWKLQHDGGEFEMGFGTVTLGRATDNDIAFPQDSNVSRYHAEIEYRRNQYVIVDLGSSNGTTVNGKKIEVDTVLGPDDEIALGGSSILSLIAPDDDEEDDSETGGVGSFGGGGATPNLAGSIPSAAMPSAAAGQSSSSGPGLMIAAGVVCGLAVVCIAAAAIFYLTRGASCDARAVITKPQAGETI